MTTKRITARHLDWAQRQLAQCRLCPRDCGVDREAGQRGWCGAGPGAGCFMEFVHYGEEPELVPSHVLYLPGCNLDCLFCHTRSDREKRRTIPLGPKKFREIIERGKKEGAVNLNLLGGEPAVHLPALIRLLAEVGDVPRLIWNSNLYCTRETLSMLRGIPDLYLIDLKFGPGECAERLAGAADYSRVVLSRLLELTRWREARVIIRHLVLPGHLDCCTAPVLHWLAGKAANARVSLKFDYLVTRRARREPELREFLSPGEKRRAENMARALGLNLVAPRLPGEEPLPTRPGNGSESSPPETVDPGLDVEFTISPGGDLFLQHPTRRATSLALSVFEPQGGSRRSTGTR